MREKTSWVNLIAIGIVGAVVLFPFVWMMLLAFKENTEIMRVHQSFFPQRLYTGGFEQVWNDSPFLRWILNSAFISVTTLVIVLATSSIAGYIFGKFQFRFKNLLFFAIMSTMMIPFQVILVPTFLITSKLGLINRYAALIIPSMVSAFGIFLVKQFAEEIPSDLIDASRIDGCGEFWILVRVILPELKPVLSALAIFTFMGKWNEYLWPLIVMNDILKMPVPLAMSFFNNKHFQNFNLSMSAAAMIMVPVFLVYLIFQRQFVEGISHTGIK